MSIAPNHELALHIRRRHVSDVVDIGIELGLGAEIEMRKRISGREI